MLNITPTLHAGLLAIAAILSLLFAGIILARNPRSSPARMHAIYGGAVAWWFWCMSMIAASSASDEMHYWARLVHLSLGMLPAVMLHLNVATANLWHKYRTTVSYHYGISVVITIFCLSWPDLFGAPQQFSWGPYPSYTVWGLVPFLFLAFVMAEIINIYRKALSVAENPVHQTKLKAFYHGNIFALIALVDFLCPFGIAVYPLAFFVLTILHIGTVFGSIRYRLTEITPEIAASHILDSLPEGVLVIDSQGIIRLVNVAGAGMLGHNNGDLVGRNFSTIAPQPLQSLLEDSPSESSDREIQFTPTDQHTQFIVRTSGSFLLDQAGESIGKVWVLHDLSAQRAAEAEKQELEDWIRHSQKLETLGVMAGGIAHDFNNLLTVIQGNAEIAQMKVNGNIPVGDELSKIIEVTEHAAELTNQMLIYAGRGQSAQAPVDLNSLCREIAELLKTAISKKANLKMEFADNLPLMVADRNQLSQVIMNLVTNASDALGGNMGLITLKTGIMESVDQGAGLNDINPGYVTLEVVDTGCGIDKETKDRMFDPFYTTKFAGRGLGLANVMGIVQAQGGRIKVESKPGSGTRITIALPPGISRGQNQTTDTIHPEWHGSGVALLVDDEPALRSMAGRMLKRAGYEVVEAADGKEAVALFRNRKKDISFILLDITMPVMDGREALAEIRSISKDIPVILMSGYSIEEVDLSGDKLAWFLSKPFRYSALSESIHTAISGNPAHRMH